MKFLQQVQKYNESLNKNMRVTMELSRKMLIRAVGQFLGSLIALVILPVSIHAMEGLVYAKNFDG